ncbi:hypothetical protein ACF073_34930 [Streptomyces sp. NPDC015171]|uniref:hypothetical protein n=1 Tax=Streptomyces sp. NPDC015171 TaxID=3364945 RepID=UPI003700D582
MTSFGRYHVLLDTGGRAVQHGWWGREEIARDKFRRWVGEWSGMRDARVTLTDGEAGTVLDIWPDHR